MTGLEEEVPSPRVQEVENLERASRVRGHAFCPTITSLPSGSSTLATRSPQG